MISTIALIVAVLALGMAWLACHLLGKLATATRELAQELVDWAEQADAVMKRDTILKRAKLK